MAPEILRGERYGISVDVWSYGMLIARLCQEGSLTEMIAINLPNKQQQNSPLMRNVNRLQRLVSRGKMLPRITKENSIPHSVREIVMECWSLEPGERPTFEDILQNLEGACKKEVLARIVPKSVSGSQKATNEEICKQLRHDLLVGMKRQNEELEWEREKAQKNLKRRMAENLKRRSAKNLH